MALTREEYQQRWGHTAYERRVVAVARLLQANGCSGVPDFYRIICLEHDIHYATHQDFATGQPLSEEEADLYLKWGIQHFSWFKHWSPVAWWRYTALSRVHGLGLGQASWESGPHRAAKQVRSLFDRSELLARGIRLLP